MVSMQMAGVAIFVFCSGNILPLHVKCLLSARPLFFFQNKGRNKQHLAFKEYEYERQR